MSAGNDFALLAALGGDMAGAISLLAPGERPVPVGHDVQWLAERELATLIDELPSRPLHADEDGEYRLSLAGAQDKLPVVLGADGRIEAYLNATPRTGTETLNNWRQFRPQHNRAEGQRESQKLYAEGDAWLAGSAKPGEPL